MALKSKEKKVKMNFAWERNFLKAKPLNRLFSALVGCLINIEFKVRIHDGTKGYSLF